MVSGLLDEAGQRRAEGWKGTCGTGWVVVRFDAGTRSAHSTDASNFRDAASASARRGPGPGRLRARRVEHAAAYHGPAECPERRGHGRGPRIGPGRRVPPTDMTTLEELARKPRPVPAATSTSGRPPPSSGWAVAILPWPWSASSRETRRTNRVTLSPSPRASGSAVLLPAVRGGLSVAMISSGEERRGPEGDSPYPTTGEHAAKPVPFPLTWLGPLTRTEAKNQALVGLEHEIPQVEGATATSGIGGKLEHGRAADTVAQTERHLVGREVQRNEESLIELPLEAEDVGGGVHQALAPGLQRGFAGAQMEKAAHERKRRGWILLLGLHAQALGLGDDRQPGARRR
jgi:hypothetical protein